MSTVVAVLMAPVTVPAYVFGYLARCVFNAFMRGWYQETP